MFQKGPGEGYHSAKDIVRALDPKLRCYNATEVLGHPYFVVLRDGPPGVGKRVGEGGPIARDAWNSALTKLRQDPQLAALSVWIEGGGSPAESVVFMAGWDSMIARDTNHTGDHPYKSPAYEAHRAGRQAAARHMDATK